MIYIFCALYPEASKIIKKYQLKKRNDLKFDVYENLKEKICLVITGLGVINAASSVAGVCTYYNVNSCDRILNLGTCAGLGDIGSVIIANKIIDATNDRTYYPDMLLKNNFNEKTLMSVPKLITRDEIAKDFKIVYDMEAVGIYGAAIRFVESHAISFVKIISDNGIDKEICAKDIENIFEKNMDFIVEYINLLKMDSAHFKTYVVSRDDKMFLDKISHDMRASVTMQNRLNQIIRYASLASLDFENIIDKYYETGKLPVKNKKEGMKVLDDLVVNLK